MDKSGATLVNLPWSFKRMRTDSEVYCSGLTGTLGLSYCIILYVHQSLFIVWKKKKRCLIHLMNVYQRTHEEAASIHWAVCAWMCLVLINSHYPVCYCSFNLKIEQFLCKYMTQSSNVKSNVLRIIHPKGLVAFRYMVIKLI